MSEPEAEKPPWFTIDAWVDIRYVTRRSDSEQYVSGEIVQDDGGVLTIEERDRNIQQSRVNPHRVIIVDTDSLVVRSSTEKRDQHLGHATKISLIVPPWDSSNDEVAGGWAIHAIYANQMVEQGIYEFPDPDYMERPEGWPDA